jgi:hypothetical protein
MDMDEDLAPAMYRYEDFAERELFGGHVTVDLPMDWIDAR